MKLCNKYDKIYVTKSEFSASKYLKTHHIHVTLRYAHSNLSKLVFSYKLSFNFLQLQTPLNFLINLFSFPHQPSSKAIFYQL